MKKIKEKKSLFPALVLPGAGSAIDKTPTDLIIFYVEKYLLPIAVALALGAIIYGGVIYITAGGNDEKAAGARKIIGIAVVGIILLVLSLVIINWVQSFWNTVL